jgi:hypothetical protein
MSAITTPGLPPSASKSKAAISSDFTVEPRSACDASAEQIRARAYEIYQARSCSGICGDPTSDWLQAEQELNGAALGPNACEINIKSQARGEKLLAGL